MHPTTPHFMLLVLPYDHTINSLPEIRSEGRSSRGDNRGGKAGKKRERIKTKEVGREKGIHG